MDINKKSTLLQHLNTHHAEAINKIGYCFDENPDKQNQYRIVDLDEEGCDLCLQNGKSNQPILRVLYDRTGDTEARILSLSYTAKHRKGQYPLIRNVRSFQLHSKQLLSPHFYRLEWQANQPLEQCPAGYAFYLSLSIFRHKTIKEDFIGQNRYYTVRQIKSATKTNPALMVMDIFIHGSSAGSQWLQQLTKGDIMETIGEYYEQLDIIQPQQPYILIADETAFPCIARWLEQPEVVNENALILLFMHCAADMAYFNDVPALQRVNYLVIPNPNAWLNMAQTAIKQHLSSNSQSVTVWGALEINTAQSLENWLISEVGLNKSCIQLKGYWRNKNK